jgi:hypothetical protein
MMPMSFTKYKWNTFYSALSNTPGNELGRICHVSITDDNKFIKRQYSNTLPCVSGAVNPYNYTQDSIRTFFENDIYWSNKLDEQYVVKPVHVNETTMEIVYQYHGSDLYHDEIKFKSIINFKQQIIEMYEYFKKENIFKGNGSRSNMLLVDGKVKAFDFKWTSLRPKGIKLELMSYENWLKAADDSLELELKAMSNLEGYSNEQFSFTD